MSICLFVFLYTCPPDCCLTNLPGSICSPPKCPCSSYMSFPPWTSTLTSVIFPPNSPLFMLHPDYPFLPLATIFPSGCQSFLLNTEWPLSVENVTTGSNGTSLSSLGDINREISLALATLWQTLCLGAIFAPCSSFSLGKKHQSAGGVSLLASYVFPVFPLSLYISCTAGQVIKRV